MHPPRRPVRLRHDQRTRRDQRGSFLELSWGGKEPFLVGGVERTFLEDGDTVVLRYSAPGAGGGRLSLGEVAGTIVPARG